METARQDALAARLARLRRAGSPALPLGESSGINRDQAQQGLAMVKQAIINLLCRKRRGMTNAEVCRELGLAAGQDGKARSMLSWSILGLLVQDGRLRKSGNYYFLAEPEPRLVQAAPDHPEPGTPGAPLQRST